MHKYSFAHKSTCNIHTFIRWWATLCLAAKCRRGVRQYHFVVIIEQGSRLSDLNVQFSCTHCNCLRACAKWMDVKHTTIS